MSYSKARPRRPSFPSPPHSPILCVPAMSTNDYVAGALGAREYLHSAQQELRSRAAGFIMPTRLRDGVADYLFGQSLDYCTGFFDALWAHIQLTLEGCFVNLQTWDVVAYLRECTHIESHPLQPSFAST